MARVFLYVAMFLLFFSVLFMIHVVVGLRLLKMFSIRPSWLIFLASGLLTLSFVVMTVLERTWPNFITKVFYIASSTWLGVLLLLFGLVLIAELLMLALPAARPFMGWSVIILTLILTGISVANAATETVREVSVRIDGLDEEVRLVQISDLHLGTARGGKYLKGIVDRVNSLSPDAVVITGDLFDSSRKLPPSDYAPLNQLEAPAYFITGNHEVYEGLDYVRSTLKTTKVRMLDDEIVDFKGIQLVGISYPPDERRGNDKVASVGIDKDKPAVLLYHAPLGLDEARDAGVDLQLSGHTHAGQVFPFNLLVRLVYPYVSGLHDHGGMKIYISPGTATWGPPMRLGSRNEITLLTLSPKDL